MKKERPARIWILDPSIKAGSNLLSILIAQISEFLQKKAIPLPKKPHFCISRVVENLSPARIQILDLSIKAVINLLSILTAHIFAEFLFWDPHAGICWNSGLVHQKMPLVGCTGIPTPLPTWICSGQCKQPPVWGEESFGCEGSRGSRPGEEEFCQQRARGFVLRKEKSGRGEAGGPGGIPCSPLTSRPHFPKPSRHHTGGK